jgi:Mg/Co/Ni transporter MgtE
MVAAVGQLIAALAAVGGLLFVGRQIRDARKTADLTALFEFLKDITKREDRFLNAASGEKRQAFNELLNFLEVTAAADNNNLFHKTTRTIVIDKICTSIAEIQEAPSWHNEICFAVRSSTTFVELRKFMERNRKAISDRVVELRSKAAVTNRPGADDHAGQEI